MTSKIPLWVATEVSLPEPDEDEVVLRDALAAAGFAPRWVPWTDESAWKNASLCIVRSTWNYHHQPKAFGEWAEALEASGCALFNSANVIKNNRHKSYLCALEAQGVRTVTTLVVGQSESPEQVIAGLAWPKFVVKPAVSAGSFQTRVFNGTETAEAVSHLRHILFTRDALIQPFMDEVNKDGERCLVWIDGECSHVVQKAPRFHADEESVRVVDAPRADELALAEQALAQVEDELLYARIDMVRDSSGEPCLMELELIEPSLFFRQVPHAAERFAKGLRRRVRQ